MCIFLISELRSGNFENTLAAAEDYSNDATEWIALAGHDMTSSKGLKTQYMHDSRMVQGYA